MAPERAPISVSCPRPEPFREKKQDETILGLQFDRLWTSTGQKQGANP